MSSTSSRSLFALIDCNNFFASCERIFRPDLEGKPVVVLSNNDGCIVARSREARALGIPMGEPEFRIRAFLRKHHVAVFSSNYELYGDMSHRVMQTIAGIVPHVEQYSIDECFIRLDGASAAHALEIAREIRERVRKWTGITVSVGIGRTRTLAKLASHIAKKIRFGLFFFNGTPEQHDGVFRRIPVQEVWGIGRRVVRRLERRGIRTVYDLKEADDVWIRRELTVTGWQTVLELRGIPCIGEDFRPTIRHTLVSSRSFGGRVTSPDDLKEAVASHAARAGVRLRKEGLVAGGLAVHIRTSRRHTPLVDDTARTLFPFPTDDTSVFIRKAENCVDSLFRAGVPYAKAGIMLFDLTPRNRLQGNLLAMHREKEDARRRALMATIDGINRRQGRQTLRFAAEGPLKAAWHMQRKRQSARVTTNWDEIAVALCN